MPNQTESCGSPPKNKPHEGTKLYTSAHKIGRGVQALQHLAITGMGKIKHFILCIFFSSTYCHLSIPFHRIQNFHNFEQLVGICAFCQKLLFNYMSFIREKKKKKNGPGLFAALLGLLYCTIHSRFSKPAQSIHNAWEPRVPILSN